jgi:hypothetical protein
MNGEGERRVADEPRTLGDGRYQLRDRLGAGGSGRVWKAYDTRLGVEVAVRELIVPGSVPERAQFELSVRAVREARALAMLRANPNVVAVHDILAEDGMPWIVMDLIEGRSLAQVVDETGVLPPTEIVRVGVGVIDALAAAHAQGILHGSVKPSNVLVASGGRVVLVGFGVAAADEAPELAGASIGTLAYTAPEWFEGGGPVPASDVFSLGATLWLAAEGRAAFTRANAEATVRAVLTEEPKPWLSGDLAALLAGMLAKDPAERISLAAARERLLAALPALDTTMPVAAPVRLPAAPATDALAMPARVDALPVSRHPGQVTVLRGRRGIYGLVLAPVATAECAFVSWALFEVADSDVAYGLGGLIAAVSLAAAVVSWSRFFYAARLVLGDDVITYFSRGHRNGFGFSRGAMTRVWMRDGELYVGVRGTLLRDFVERGMARKLDAEVDLHANSVRLGRLDGFRDVTAAQAEAAVRAFAGDLWAGGPPLVAGSVR